MTDQYEWVVASEYHNERIDKVIPKWKKKWSRSQVQAWISKNYIVVNNRSIKSNYRVKTNDIVRVHIPTKRTFTLKAENIPLSIVYEDETIIVINKKRGIVVHPAPSHLTGTVANALLSYTNLSDVAGQLRQGIVHRLDKDTSGLLLVAKTKEAYTFLQEQFKSRTVKRVYKAIVHGALTHSHGTIDAPIGRDVKDRRRMTVTDENSREARTHFKTLDVYKNYSIVQCELETGRMHQIRVHMEYIGHPVVGDPVYSLKHKQYPISGQALHAFALTFIHPHTKKEVHVEAPLPADMERMLNSIKKE